MFSTNERADIFCKHTITIKQRETPSQMVYYIYAPVTLMNKSEEQNTNLPAKAPLWVSFSHLVFVEILVG